MKKIALVLGIMFCFNMRLLAHGTEALAFAVPILIYFLILPIYISIWDYKSIVKNLSNNEFSERGLWIQNYLIGIGTYSLVYLIAEKIGIINDTVYLIVLIVSLLFLQTFGKSLSYYIFNASKKVSILKILESIYQLNIAIILAAIGLGFVLYYLIVMLIY